MPARQPKPPKSATVFSEVEDDDRAQRVVQRPDGYHWIAPDGHQEFGPFASLEEALADMGDAADDGVEPGETLEEAERELGLAEWLDPDTGSLAEGTSPRLEDH
ncbi:MAG: hypothetical protein U1E89_17290 [Burkholderiaceae bacterium]